MAGHLSVVFGKIAKGDKNFKDSVQVVFSIDLANGVTIMIFPGPSDLSR